MKKKIKIQNEEMKYKTCQNRLTVTEVIHWNLLILFIIVGIVVM